MAYKYITLPNISPHSFSREVLFVTEGQDDALFLEALLEARKEDVGRIEVRYTDGIGGISGFLSGIAKSPAFTQHRLRAICVIVDADDSFQETEKRFQKELHTANLPSPNAGAVVARDRHWIGLYIFPRTGSIGMLEDLVLDSIRTDPRAELANNVLQKRIEEGIPLDLVSKRAVQIFLAISEGQICRGLGRGIRNGTIPFDHNTFEELNTFLDDFLAYR